MLYKDSLGRKAFLSANFAILLIISIVCLLPFINILALSFSSAPAAARGVVKFWPVDATTAAYTQVLGKKAFLVSVMVSVERVLLGTTVNMLLTILSAYPLSKEVKDFRFRTLYVWVFMITMLFSGGLIPWYITIKATGLLDHLWALILPGAVPVFSVVLMLNFFRGLPKELEEAAKIDGAGQFTTLWKIYVPLSLPSLATLTLFSMVGHWNSWFDGIILMNRPEHYPLQSFLQTVIIKIDHSLLTEKDAELLSVVSERTNRSAQIILATLPILMVYPFLQKYFITGIVLGSVKE